MAVHGNLISCPPDYAPGVYDVLRLNMARPLSKVFCGPQTIYQGVIVPSDLIFDYLFLPQTGNQSPFLPFNAAAWLWARGVNLVNRGGSSWTGKFTVGFPVGAQSHIEFGNAYGTVFIYFGFQQATVLATLTYSNGWTLTLDIDAQPFGFPSGGAWTDHIVMTPQVTRRGVKSVPPAAHIPTESVHYPPGLKMLFAAPAPARAVANMPAVRARPDYSLGQDVMRWWVSSAIRPLATPHGDRWTYQRTIALPVYYSPNNGKLVWQFDLAPQDCGDVESTADPWFRSDQWLFIGGNPNVCLPP